MKKLIFALIVVFTLAPFSAFGLEMIKDDILKDVTAQAGISNLIDNLLLEQCVEKTKYIDESRLGSKDFCEVLVPGEHPKDKFNKSINTATLHCNATLTNRLPDATRDSLIHLQYDDNIYGTTTTAANKISVVISLPYIDVFTNHDIRNINLFKLLMDKSL